MKHEPLLKPPLLLLPSSPLLLLSFGVLLRRLPPLASLLPTLPAPARSPAPLKCDTSSPTQHSACPRFSPPCSARPRGAAGWMPNGARRQYRFRFKEESASPERAPSPAHSSDSEETAGNKALYQYWMVTRPPRGSSAGLRVDAWLGPLPRSPRAAGAANAPGPPARHRARSADAAALGQRLQHPGPSRAEAALGQPPLSRQRVRPLPRGSVSWDDIRSRVFDPPLSEVQPPPGLPTPQPGATPPPGATAAILDELAALRPLHPLPPPLPDAAGRRIPVIPLDRPLPAGAGGGPGDSHHPSQTQSPLRPRAHERGAVGRGPRGTSN